MFLKQSNCFHKAFLKHFFIDMIVYPISIITLPYLTFTSTWSPIFSTKCWTTFGTENHGNKRSISIIYSWPLAMFLSPKTPFQWKQTNIYRVNEDRIRQFLAITSTHSKNFFTLILTPFITKSLAIKAFLNSFRYKVFTLLLVKLHTQHGASAEIDPPAVLSSIHSPALGRVWYHAPWLRHCRKYRRCGLLPFERLLW